MNLETLADSAVNKVRTWLKYSSQESDGDVAAKRLAAVLSDPHGLEFTVGFVDRVIRTEDVDAAANALHELQDIMPESMSRLDRAQIRAGSLLGRRLPNVVVPAARARIRQMVGHMIVDARDKPFTKAVAELTADGHRLNINLLGEAVLGEEEALKHLNDTRDLVARSDVDYVSVKVSSVASQISMWGFDATVDEVVERLTPLYIEAAQAPAGTKFINLDMEEYRDLRLTIEVFKRLLSLPETANLDAGIVLQAYLPDALASLMDLSDFADHRVAAGGAGIKVRLVKGANLAMERVHAEISGWPLTTQPTKHATDANYKRILTWALDRERMRSLRLGIAGHNLFDIAFAHLLSVDRGVSDRVEFEMLQGMAADQAKAVSHDVGELLLYVPAVRPSEFDAAISYLVRRLEENSASENFMSGIFELRAEGPVFAREEARFRSSISEVAALMEEPVPEPNDGQDRGKIPSPTTAIEFFNEPDTNPALPANQQWAAAALAQAGEPGWLEAQVAPASISSDDVEDLVSATREAAVAWAARPARERADILLRAADILARQRGHFISVAAAEVGKTIAQSDPEISEAIDFARYYAHLALELENVDNATFTPDRVVVVTPPWNFPIAIPAGSTLAALAAGAAVIHKPSRPSQRCSAAVVECLWEAGVPRDVLHCVYPTDRDAGRELISHPGVDRVVLTGSADTAGTFSSWRPTLTINGETSGKNAIVITPSADRDLAVADVVNSAFGHAGQKCSAASLGILVGSVYESERFRKQLIDAASSMVVDWPENASATMGPLTEEPSDKLRHALTTLDPGERWLLEPRQLDDTGRLWSPGIKEGVHDGSFFHLSEVFGPVLGLMKAATLDEALELQNATEFGLTGGFQSLDPAEVKQWINAVKVGNAYVNRGITGAIVRRQPFGGWKKSSVGLGSKAGGPNYVMLMGHWSDSPGEFAPTAASPLITRCARTLDPGEVEWLEIANASDQDAWEMEFSQPRDPSDLNAEANIFRYLPATMVLRIADDAAAKDVVRALVAIETTGAKVRILRSVGVSAKVRAVLDRSDVTVEVVDESVFINNLIRGDYDDAFSARVRIIGSVSTFLRERLSSRPEVALLDDAVTSSGRVELRYWLQEQSLSITMHRFGNPSEDFHKLAGELKDDRLTGSAYGRR